MSVCEYVSLPVRGAWIEIISAMMLHDKDDKSLPVRGAWIEITSNSASISGVVSLPVRGAWIEITHTYYLDKIYTVAPCEGSVD